MKKILENYLHCFMLVVVIMSTVVLCAQTDNGAAGAGADSDAGVAIETFTDMQVVKEKGKNILLKVKVDVPSDYPELQKYICSKMFGTDDNSLEKGYIKYLSRHEVVKDDALAAKMVKENKDVFTLEITASGYKPGAYLSYDATLLYDGETVRKDYYVLFDLQTRKVMGYHDVFSTDEFALKPEREKGWNFALAPDEGVLYAFPEDGDTNSMPLDKIKNQLTDKFKSFIDWSAVSYIEPKEVSDLTFYEPSMVDGMSYLRMDDGVCRLVYNNRFKDVMDFSDSEIDGLINGDDPKINAILEKIEKSGNKDFCKSAVKRFPIIGKEIRFAKEYMEQQAKKKAGTFVEDENSIYSNGDCDKHAKIPRAVIYNAVNGLPLLESKYIYISFLIEKDGSFVVPILESNISSKGENRIVSSYIVFEIREHIKKCTPGKKNGKNVRSVVRIKFRRNSDGRPLLHDVSDDEVAE